ncbi:hypothetical protein Lal_00019915 [Lupinus albus]|uniref:Uncharacterized protein n=1 Tax=Lupinus albus TaxID=3870 RepID=A0A6A5PQU7_LUPAL|nr:hypothetical protein Lalb_Chr01g0005501 [Lupinus albus]KAF1899783.1 hypothetical protein Lal_00019915 [Lupinus albus]
MGRVAGIVLCLLVVIMDVAAGFLGFEAEKAQNKVKHVRVLMFECKKPSHQAFILGSGAALLLGVAHATANFLGCCSCIWSQGKTSSNRKCSLLFIIISWLVLAIGMYMLVTGTMSNKKSDGPCGFNHHYYLYNGGILCFVHGILCVVYCVSNCFC